MVSTKITTVSITPEILEELERAKKVFKVKSKYDVILHWKNLANKYIQYRRRNDFQAVSGIEDPNKFMEILQMIRNDQKTVIWEELKNLKKEIKRLKKFRMQVVDMGDDDEE